MKRLLAHYLLFHFYMSKQYKKTEEKKKEYKKGCKAIDFPFHQQEKLRTSEQNELHSFFPFRYSRYIE
ncbi:hypothetical protein A7Q09_05690 [Methylacidiphilum sp. Yel]|jgi:hypothetical protein|uniref:hypothetical protein n=1 Tax=Methylacidiphilum sp. Yel TaxID=1847730 RepID=UPI0010694D53|nr:hypothetical protein [Methylacidiphilum sp. Yel]TFE69379.1 hypothetical protein A7Q09_05690 [Methylacidiphilum sp. Yel]